MSVPEDENDSDKHIGAPRRYSHEDFIDALEEMDGMATTTELSDIVGCSNNTTRKNMDELTGGDDSPVSERDVGRYSLWMLDTE